MKSKLNWDMYDEIQKTTKDLAKRKNHDYGTDSLTDFGSIGCLIRINDKVNRLKTLFKHKIACVDTETIEDTCLDIINYSIYLIMLEKNMLEVTSDE